MLRGSAIVVLALLIPVYGRGAADTQRKELQENLLKPNPEFVIDVTVLELKRDQIIRTDSPGGGVGSFAISVPGASFMSLESDSDVKILHNCEIRASNYQKSTLKIGDQIPIVTGSLPLFGADAASPLARPQFKYIDVGVSIDITPYVHATNEVALKVGLEVSSVTGSETVDGITQPIIGHRRIEHETAVAYGDVNILGGILNQQETQSLTGYPWIGKVPVLKSLFGQDNKEQAENEIVFVMAPHVLLR